MPDVSINRNSPENAPRAFTCFCSTLVKILILVYAANYFSFVTADSDLWGHVKFGQEIWSTRTIPETDTFSYTANGLPWINHEWLAEVLFYLIYDSWNSTGLLFFKLVVGLLMIHVLSLLYWAKEQNAFIYLFYFMILIPVLAPGFMVRPHLLTYLFLTLLVFIFYKFFDGNSKALAWTPLLMLVWANCHGGIVAGIGIYGIVVLCELSRRSFSGENRGRLLLMYFCLSCLASLVNPHGYKLWLFFFHSLSLPREISEWNPIALWDTSHLQYKALVLLFLATLMSPVRKRAWEVTVILGAIYFGFRHQRHSVLTAIVMTPYLSLQLAQWVKKIQYKPGLELGQISAGRGLVNGDLRLSPMFYALFSMCLTLFIALQAIFVFHHYRTHNYKILVEPQVYPVYAAQFMQANNIKGNILVPSDWGEYVIWKLPESKVSVDGRFRTVYPEKIIKKSRDFSMGLEGWRAMVDDYPTQIILIRKSDQTQRVLEKAGDWAKIYEDPTSMLFVAKTIPPGETLRNFYDQELINPTERPSYEFP